MLDGLSAVWPTNLATLVFLLLISLLYLLGLRHARRHYPEKPVGLLRIVAFFSAIAISALLLLTPVDTIARTQFFSVHMAQTVLLTTLCAPLIFAGCPEEVLLPLLKIPVVRDILRFITRPLVASLLFNLTFLLWHTPKLFSMAQQNETLYHVVMLAIFFTSLLNWSPLISATPELKTMGYPMQMVYAFFDGQPVDIFAFILVFTGVALYPLYPVPTQVGLYAFSDQAVGGAMLLIPGLVDLGVMTPLFIRWLGDIEQHTKLGDEKRQRMLEAQEVLEAEDEEEWEDEDEVETSSEK